MTLRLKWMVFVTGALGLLGAHVAFTQDIGGDADRASAAGVPLPGESLYQLPVRLLTAENRNIQLADLRGRPLLITMFYSHCASVCPLITTRLQRLVADLSPADREQVRILMVSFDATRDTPATLTEFKAEHHIEDSSWIIAHASAGDVRLLAAALGIRFRELPDHTFNHSALISLVDRDGVVRAHTSELTATDETFVRAIHVQVAARPQY